MVASKQNQISQVVEIAVGCSRQAVVDGQPPRWMTFETVQWRLDVQDVSEGMELDAKRAKTGSGPE